MKSFKKLVLLRKGDLVLFKVEILICLIFFEMVLEIDIFS